MKRVLVLGSYGMLGHQVMRALEQHGGDLELFDVSHRCKYRAESITHDLTDQAANKQLIEGIRPDVVINCVGVLVKGSGNNTERAILLNAYLPHFLARTLAEYGGRLIHVSTDCVFSGLSGPYVEDSNKDGVGTYSLTKSLGEVYEQGHLTLRTSIIGPELKDTGEGLFHWFMSQNEEVCGYSSAIWSGVTTKVLSQILLEVLWADTSGLCHVTNNCSISKYDLLQLFKKSTQKHIGLKKIPGINCNKALLDTRNDITFQIPSYPDMIADMIADMNSNRSLYAQYFNKDLT